MKKTIKKKLYADKEIITSLETQLAAERKKSRETQKRLDHSRSVVVTLTKQLEELNVKKVNIPFFGVVKRWNLKW